MSLVEAGMVGFIIEVGEGQALSLITPDGIPVGDPLGEAVVVIVEDERQECRFFFVGRTDGLLRIIADASLADQLPHQAAAGDGVCNGVKPRFLRALREGGGMGGARGED